LRGGSGSERTHRFDGVPQTLAIPHGFSRPRRALRALLAIGQVAPQYDETGSAEALGEGHQQRRLGIRPRPVCQDQTVPTRAFWAVEESSNGWVAGAIGVMFNAGDQGLSATGYSGISSRLS
jgi:hypothetical protein